MPPFPATEAYDGTAAFQDTDGPGEIGGPVQVAVTAGIAVLPPAGLGVALWLAWGHGVGLTDVLLMAALYVITGLGVTVGFHRGFTHRSFKAAPALRVALAVAGSMAVEGNLISWVATHRRHHAFTDRPGDPHSPYRYGTTVKGMLRGLVDSHVGWMFRNDPTPAQRYAPDLLADPALRRVSQAFPLLILASLAIPFAAGWAIGGDLRAGLAGLLWGGLVRIGLLQHVTWSVNSLCHVLGSRPFITRRFDRATNLWPLALLSFGESWHNLHHSDPTSARHGVDRGQIDLSAGLIRVFERLGWASDVRWPSVARLDGRRCRGTSEHSTVVTPRDAVPEPGAAPVPGGVAAGTPAGPQPDPRGALSTL